MTSHLITGADCRDAGRTADMLGGQAPASALASEYATQHPFPHVVLPNFLQAGVAEQLSAEFALAESGPWTHWAHYNENKSGLTERSAFPPLMGRVVDELNSDAFVGWLSELTGIPNLLADPTLEGGGMHQCGAGGFLNIHADFIRHHHKTHWRRRVNLIVYLNPEWKPEWGGAIELWDRRMQQCVVRVPPLANQAVIFNTDEHSYHGFPVPVACPAGVMRRSLALYYYTAEDDLDARVVPRSTNYQPRPEDGIKERALIWADKQLVHLYSLVKSRLGLSDAFASRSLAWFDHWRRSHVKRGLEAGAWMVAIALGAAQAWTWRFRPSTMDLVSYLDVGDAYVRGHWKEAINGYWNPLYSWILGVVMAVVQPSARLEYPTAKLVDFLIYLLCLSSFAWLLANLRRVYRDATAAQSDEVPAIPDWAWIVGGYTLFIWSSLRWITLSSSTPDMAGTALLYGAWALLLRLEQRTRRADYLLLGAILALAYFSRTPMFIVAVAVLMMKAFHTVTTRDRRGVLAAAVVFLGTDLAFRRGDFTCSWPRDDRGQRRAQPRVAGQSGRVRHPESSLAGWPARIRSPLPSEPCAVDLAARVRVCPANSRNVSSVDGSLVLVRRPDLPRRQRRRVANVQRQRPLLQRDVWWLALRWMPRRVARGRRSPRARPQRWLVTCATLPRP